MRPFSFLFCGIRLLKNWSGYREESQMQFAGWKKCRLARDSQCSVSLGYRKGDQEVAQVQCPSTFIGRKDWLLKGSLIEWRRVEQDPAVGSWSQPNPWTMRTIAWGGCTSAKSPAWPCPCSAQGPLLLLLVVGPSPGKQPAPLPGSLLGWGWG